MVYRLGLACAGMIFCLTSLPAFAIDQLPLPDGRPMRGEIQVAEFASAAPLSSASRCAEILSGVGPLAQTKKAGAIKAYRQCRAEKALQQLAVATWERPDILKN